MKPIQRRSHRGFLLVRIRSGFDHKRVCANAVRLAVAFDGPVYDCVYLALGHRIGVTLVTADTRFANAVAASEHDGAVAVLTDFKMD